MFIFTAITAGYVITGGMKAIMYADAFQAVLRFVLMAIFIFWTTYSVLGGLTNAHQQANRLADRRHHHRLQRGHRGAGSYHLLMVRFYGRQERP